MGTHPDITCTADHHGRRGLPSLITPGEKEGLRALPEKTTTQGIEKLRSSKKFKTERVKGNQHETSKNRKSVKIKS